MRNPEKLPFNKIVSCNIGNPQQLGQQPLTFVRQVLAILEYPALLDKTHLFPADVVKRAKGILNIIGSTGAYSHSQGIPAVRDAVARFIGKRDGFPTTQRQIFLTNGASDAVSRILGCIITSPDTGVHPKLKDS